MVRVIDDEKVIAVVASDINGNEGTLEYVLKNPRMVDLLPGMGSPRVEKFLDVAGTRRDGAKSISVAYHLGMTSSMSGYLETPLLDSVTDLRKAFIEAGFREPPVEVPLNAKLIRAARSVRNFVFGGE